MEEYQKEKSMSSAKRSLTEKSIIKGLGAPGGILHQEIGAEATNNIKSKGFSDWIEAIRELLDRTSTVEDLSCLNSFLLAIRRQITEEVTIRE